MQKNFLYIRFYKPFQVLSQFTSSPEHRNLSEFGLPKSVYSIGRLDYDSEGLLLFTNDGPFKHQLLSPSYDHPRTYFAQVEKIPSAESLARLESGAQLNDFKTKPCSVTLLDEEPVFPPRETPIRFRKNIPTAWLKITIFEGKNRQIRRMTASIGHPTLRLIRSSIAQWSLDGLRPGAWDTISASEIKKLY